MEWLTWEIIGETEWSTWEKLGQTGAFITKLIAYFHMGCYRNCKELWFKHETVYGDACDFLAERNRDCTIVDACCRNMPYLHEIKRHLLNRHNVRCRTIGIDVDIYDIEVDRFINKEISKVDMPGIADVVQ